MNIHKLSSCERSKVVRYTDMYMRYVYLGKVVRAYLNDIMYLNA